MLNRSLLRVTESPTPLSRFARWLLVAAALVLPGSATAIPVTFTSSDTIAAGATIPGVSAGDALTLTVVVDNGNATLLNQSWNLADIVSAVASVGTYSATYLPPHQANPIEPVFRTTSTGAVQVARWINGGPNNTDVFSSGAADADVVFAQNALIDAQSRFASLNGNVLAEEQWSVVPEPSTLSLSALGLSGLAAARRRRTAT